MADISSINSSTDPLSTWNGSNINANNLNMLYQEAALGGINDEDPNDTMTVSQPTDTTDDTNNSWKKARRASNGIKI